MTRRKSPTRGIIVFILGVLLALLLFFHSRLPETKGLALVVESALPWTVVLVVLLIIMGLIRFSFLGILGFLIPAVVWCSMFGGYLRPTFGTADGQLTVATQNVGAKLSQPTATAQNLLDRKPDVLAVQELASKSGKIIKSKLDGAYSYSRVEDSLGLWSKYPLGESKVIDLGLKWPRAFRTVLAGPNGDIALYAVHIPSVRIGEEDLRNAALEKLAQIVRQDSAGRVIMLGDLNAGGADRYLGNLTTELQDSRAATGGGFGATWPTQFPLVRLDHVLTRGFDVKSDEVLDRGTSDHRAVVVRLDQSE
ncbi:endonuclease/exonuclease/phosphatase family protein [Brevibacterium sp. 50QC2O2]|uniref:endonuclease/exonuclease/phosphatase family protein n=1 Tax=unclassified Brevibacterium TaxID=2614124 RepID=UPI00211BF322|nr:MULTISPECIES: endonuclease/exonuclease/phosphatase family protein [unclassified Brevibacterium]MCQ9367927.1 endonuclease/exonuclease/phosphatase family protein [Brevibacterium sp. 91QC2O2]MCQ9387108.1 endonuclease/exonuclease/phosphatase family protein [Brevibacterium sp. 50QC2O2]